MKHVPFGLVVSCIVLVFALVTIHQGATKRDTRKRHCELSGGIFLKNAGAGYVCFDKKAEIKP